MIKHIVMWTIKKGATPRMKFERMAEVKTRLIGLKEKINEISGMDVYFNSPLAPDDNYDIILVSEFNSWADLDLYKKHPDHLEVASYINNVKEKRTAIDFEF